VSLPSPAPVAAARHQKMTHGLPPGDFTNAMGSSGWSRYAGAASRIA